MNDDRYLLTYVGYGDRDDTTMWFDNEEDAMAMLAVYASTPVVHLSVARVTTLVEVG